MSFHVRTTKHLTQDEDAVLIHVVMSAPDAVALGRLLREGVWGTRDDWTAALGALGTALFEAGDAELRRKVSR